MLLLLLLLFASMVSALTNCIFIFSSFYRKQLHQFQQNLAKNPKKQPTPFLSTFTIWFKLRIRFYFNKLCEINVYFFRYRVKTFIHILHIDFREWAFGTYIQKNQLGHQQIKTSCNQRKRSTLQ